MISPIRTSRIKSGAFVCYLLDLCESVFSGKYGVLVHESSNIAISKRKFSFHWVHLAFGKYIPCTCFAEQRFFL